MKQGLAVADFARELKRQAETKKDYIADTRQLAVKNDPSGICLEIDGIGEFGITDWAHHQLAERNGIPYGYYKRMREDAPDLLVDNVQHWFREEPQPRYVRTLDGDARAFLSNGYKPLDNYDFAGPVLNAVANTSFEIVSCALTEKRLYIKCVDPSPEALVTIMPPGTEMGVGHRTYYKVRPGFTLTNSEVGCGALAIAPAIQEDHCTNYAVFSKDAARRHHFGTRRAVEDAPFEVSDRTRELQDGATISELLDALNDIIEGKAFARHCERLREARGQKFRRPDKVVEVVARKVSLLQGEAASVLEHLIEGGELSRYGMHAAITRTAEDVESYDRASELERMGGMLIEMKPREWEDLTARLN